MLIFKNLYNFFLSLYQQKKVIGQLAKRDFQNKYLSSYLGIPWIFLQPTVTIIVMWFAFKIGLNISYTQNGVPFIPWLICGLIPWFFISDTLLLTSGSLIEYSDLIAKTTFRVSIIPIIKIINGVFIHLFFILFLIIYLFLNGYYPNIYWLQIIYLILANIFLLTGLGWLISSITVYIKDMKPIINIIISIMFWATPLIWSYSVLNGNYKYIALLNPFFYIIEGYRYAFLGNAWMFQNIEMTVFFWITTSVIFISGAIVFKKLSPRFADEI